MALTQVRAKLGDSWVTLTYNEATGRYEGYLTPPGTSIHQPGGYFNISVDVTNQAGETDSISGTQLASLRLVVRETTAPVLTLISPTPGYLKTQTPTFIFDAVDEAGGSGVDPASFTADQAGSVSYTAITNGYRFTWHPAAAWADGPHTVTVSVSDYDGNQSTVSGSYTVDTVPPELLLRQPDQRHVVDDESVTVAGEAWDVTAPNVTVTVGGAGVPVTGGKFSADVPLSIGENHIQVVATDGAGNQTTKEVYMIRLVTDRTENDVEFLRGLYDKPWEEWPEATQAWFLQTACLRGSYDAEDLNRVGIAVAWLAAELRRRGYIADVQTKTDWTQADSPTLGQMNTYLRNAETVRTAQPVYILPEIPHTMRYSSINDWNDIEKALVETDSYFPGYVCFSSGEVSCGEG